MGNLSGRTKLTKYIKTYMHTFHMPPTMFFHENTELLTAIHTEYHGPPNNVGPI